MNPPSIIQLGIINDSTEILNADFIPAVILYLCCCVAIGFDVSSHQSHAIPMSAAAENESIKRFYS